MIKKWLGLAGLVLATQTPTIAQDEQTNFEFTPLQIQAETEIEDPFELKYVGFIELPNVDPYQYDLQYIQINRKPTLQERQNDCIFAYMGIDLQDFEDRVKQLEEKYTYHSPDNRYSLGLSTEGLENDRGIYFCITFKDLSAIFKR